ncbi:hypothetical protein DFH94DRAFT_476958 [Russula ochroleuca]|uniref:Uncharacterized protein n=1 Tax=Russula ochroleuca TaxID=152965 RepID=A0A9P5MWH9_9AGAM|nr:hypothetical protein DFH94DRAFT_476958 [Russula ochroleuca]
MVMSGCLGLPMWPPYSLRVPTITSAAFPGAVGACIHYRISVLYLLFRLISISVKLLTLPALPSQSYGGLST